jgi:hypothetical protein
MNDIADTVKEHPDLYQKIDNIFHK